MNKQQRNNVKKQFIEVVRCLGPERIKISGFKRMFRKEPELLKMVNDVEIIARRIEHRHLDPELADVIVSNILR
jgi:hypothetical protein